MKKKVLFAATIAPHINAFHLPVLKFFQESGWETHVAAFAKNEEETQIPYCNCFHNTPFTRQPFTKRNVDAYFSLKKLIEEKEFDIIHCHTPVGGVLTRLAAKNMRRQGKTKVIYTAHGFHFFTGAPAANWLLYYPTEKILSKYTDVLITINKEDFERAKNFPAGKVEYVPGVGIDIEKIRSTSVNRAGKRKEIGVPEDAYLLISVGELNKNKNHETAITALSRIKDDKNIHYIIAGDGVLKNHLADLASNLGLENNVHLLGPRKDISQLLKTSDCFVFPSYREGLSVSLMEAMAAGLPVVCSGIRGNTDLIKDGVNGYLFKPSDAEELAQSLKKVIAGDGQSAVSRYEDIEPFGADNVLRRMKKIYSDIIGGTIRV